MSRSVVTMVVVATLGSLVAAHALARATGGNGGGAPAASRPWALEMKRYRNEAWKFELDVPQRWTVTPPGAEGGALARFMSIENGHHLLVVSRHLMRAGQTPKDVVDQNEKRLTEKGFASFVRGEAMIGSIRATTLDYQRVGADGKPTYYRQYYVIQGPVGYQLAFGTTNREAMLTLYGRVAQSFVFEDL